jgi:hypothetical protein
MASHGHRHPVMGIADRVMNDSSKSGKGTRCRAPSPHHIACGSALGSSSPNKSTGRKTRQETIQSHNPSG